MQQRLQSASRLAIALLAAGLLSGTAAVAAPTEWAPGRLLVMPRAGLEASELRRILQPHGGVARRIGRSDLHVVQLPSNMSETAVLQRLARHPLLKFAELDYKVTPAMAANDPYAGSQWHLAKTRSDLAWSVTGGSGVTIAILDSGVLPSHPDLQINLVPGYNSHDGSTVTTDVTGHGTTVAGVAGAALNNAVGVAGIAGLAKVMPIRITDAAGTAYYSTIASGVIHAADQGVRVVNCSYGFLFKNASVQSAGNYLKSKGGLLVVSAGNNGIDENSPATTAMITVSATDPNDLRTSWSSFGQMVSVAAPGSGIWTTGSDGAYRSVNGTSYSSPLVAGVVALMMSSNPTLAPSQIENLLFSTAVDLGAAGKDVYFGYGRVDADAAVLAAQAANAPDVQAPSVSLTTPSAGGTVSGLVPVDVSASDNVGVTVVELRVNGAVVATDSVAPFQFSWDSSATANGSAQITATARDAAGNVTTSASRSVTVSNGVPADTLAPVVSFGSPGDGQTVSGTAVTVKTTATDNSGAAGIRQSLAIDGKTVASVTGGTLSYKWSLKRVAAGAHTLLVTATDAAGNQSIRSIQVRR